MEQFSAAFESATLASCEANAAEIAAALSRALGQELTVSVAGLLDSSGSAPAAWRGPGLLIPLRVAGEGGVGRGEGGAGGGHAVAILPAASGLLPDSIAQPDAASLSRRETLARQLAKLLFAPQAGAQALPSLWAPNLSAAFEYPAGARSRHRLSLALRSGARVGALELIWPVALVGAPDAAVAAIGAAATAAGVAAAGGPSQKPAAPASSASPSSSGPSSFHAHPTSEPSRQSDELTLESLPSFSRNLLRIKMPVMVTLASKKQAVGKIIELLPGSIIQFSKSCEEMLEMEVSGHPIALGECVKVGDKFGLRITSIQLPGERFQSVARSRSPR